MGAALTKPGRAGTARRLGSGEQDGKVYECRNQWLNPLKRCTDSNLVDMGRVPQCTPLLAVSGGDSDVGFKGPTRRLR